MNLAWVITSEVSNSILYLQWLLISDAMMSESDEAQKRYKQQRNPVDFAGLGGLGGRRERERGLKIYNGRTVYTSPL